MLPLSPWKALFIFSELLVLDTLFLLLFSWWLFSYYPLSCLNALIVFIDFHLVTLQCEWPFILWKGKFNSFKNDNNNNNFIANFHSSCLQSFSVCHWLQKINLFNNNFEILLILNFNFKKFFHFKIFIFVMMHCQAIVCRGILFT